MIVRTICDSKIYKIFENKIYKVFGTLIELLRLYVEYNNELDVFPVVILRHAFLDALNRQLSQ